MRRRSTGRSLRRSRISDKLDPKLSKTQEGYATDGYLVPVYRNQTGFVYDPDKVPNPPQSWAEFTAWLDANPGQFAFNDPSKGGSGQAFVQAAIVNILGDEDSYAGDTELERIEDRRLAEGLGVVQRQRGQVHHHRLEQRLASTA